MYLDYAEKQAERRRPLYMRDQREKLDAFLAFNEGDIPKDAGRVSMEVAEKLAIESDEAFDRRRLGEEAAAPDEFEAEAKPLAAKAPAPNTDGNDE